MSLIQEVVQAHIYMPLGDPCKRELQMLVYREGCNGETSLVTMGGQELVDLLNAREAK